MKQTLILGLALAANAMTADQVDNELIVAPSGGKFGDLGKLTTKMSRVMFDEQANDELLIRPVVQADDDEFIAMLLPREHFKTEEEYQKYVARMRFSKDDAADDELLLQYHYAADGRAIPYNHHFDQVSKTLTITKMDDDELFVAPQGKLADLAKKYPGMIMFDEQADDELLAIQNKPRFEETKHAIFLRGERERERKLREQMRLKQSQAADDEELFYSPSGKYPHKLNGGVILADDELLIRPVVQADDDEFIVMLLPREHFKTEEEYQKYVAKMRFQRDDADDELLIKFNRFNKEKRQEVVNAADDDELFVAPQGKLADLAKKYPGMIMFDEQADDELVALEKKRPFEESKHAIFLRGQRERERKLREQMGLKEESKFTEDYRQWLYGKRHQAADDEELFYSPEGRYPNKLNGAVMRDEAADDELRVRPLATADDELLLQYHYAGDGRAIPYNHHFDQVSKTLTITKMDDDELFVAPQGKLADLAKRYPGMIMFDEEADSELRIINGVPVDEYGYPIRGGPIARFDDQADDELFVMDHSIPEQYKHIAPKNLHLYRSEEADDELLIRPLVQADDDEFISLLTPRDQFKTEEEYQKYVARMRYARPIRNCWGRPTGKPINKDIVQAKDDELRGIDNLPRDEFGRIVRPPYARFDEVADDELVYLGNLMKYLENEKIVAAAAHTFDDDELRAEKASHVKAQEMKQIKSEMPKMKRKMRPADETAFLA